MKKSNKKILITGGAGFIGINAARHFLDQGWQVTLFDNFSRKGTDINVKNLLTERPGSVKVVKGDICINLALLDKLVESHDAVLHLAAQVAVTTSIANPRHDYEQNALGTLNVLESIRQSDNKPPIIFSSTNKVYGALSHLSVNETESRYRFDDKDADLYGVSENHPLNFHSPYGCSKGAADQYVIDYARIYGLKTVVFRQSCIYGKHQFGIEDQGWVAWFTIAAMLERPLTVFGIGKQVRDILYVEDLCKLFELAVENIDKASGNAYNTGGGPSNTLSLIELIDILNNTYGYNLNPKKAEQRAGDQPVFIADIRKVANDLGWKSEVGVEEGIKKMHEWLTDNKAILKNFFA